MEAVLFIGGVIVIFWQVGKQFENNRKLQREDYKEKLKIEIHKEISDQLTRTGNHTPSVEILLVIQHIAIFRDTVSAFPDQPPVLDRSPIINDEYFLFSKEVNKLIALLERFEITFSGSRIFRIALVASSDDAMYAFLEFHSKLIKFLPMDIPENMPPLPDGSRIMIPTMPSSENFEELKELGDVAKNKIDDVSSYLFDLNVEIQNIMLGHLFEAKVPVREPLDPNLIVITSEDGNIDELENYFYENTEWGKRKNKTEEDVRNSLEGEGT